ncbi:EF-hand calcium-binding domain-containing protein 14 isoform X2 [Hyperolius riggenbachi]|uniref:EF-hand calcium-binding domain-containing protein 14 isoform X2 n=1 Tax=Hyperolius riggenbachi TaxID=752182 RepID=UPI0035A27E71
MGSGALSSGPPAPSTPHKKMKKRKELNALIGLAGDGKKKGGHHRLLRTERPDSDTDTETEDYSAVTERNASCGRGGILQCCRVCYPVCAFIVLAGCVMACIGLVWMQIVLKENLDLLKEQIKSMESKQQNSAQDIPGIKEDLLAKQKKLDEFVSGEHGLDKLWTNLTDMNRQIIQLSSAVNQLKANLKSASDVINLPKTMEELQKSVATLGSTLTSVHHDVETLQAASEEQKKKVEALQKDVAGVTSRLSPTGPPATGTHSLTQVESSLEDLNTTFVFYQQHNDLRLNKIEAAASNISQRVATLEANQPVTRNEKENISGLVENSADVNGNQLLNSSKVDSSQKSRKEETPVSDIQEQLQLIHALTNKPDTEKVANSAKTDNSDTVTARTPLTKKYPRSVVRRRRQKNPPFPGTITRQAVI